MLEEKNPTFMDILDYISEKKTNYFARLAGTGLRISDKEEQKIENSIMETIDKLRSKNETFDKSYMNLVFGGREPDQRKVSKRDFCTMIYLNFLPENAKVTMAQIINSRRMQVNIPPIIRPKSDNKVIKHKAFFGDESVESVEDLFNKQLLNTVEVYFHKIVAKMSERQDDDLELRGILKDGCEVDKAYRELKATALLAENLGFDVQEILVGSEIGDLYSFIKRGSLIRSRHR